MAAITYGANSKTEAPAAVKRPGLLRILFEAFVEARQMQAEAEIRRYYGGRLPEALTGKK
jgi:hypothetical protein